MFLVSTRMWWCCCFCLHSGANVALLFLALFAFLLFFVFCARVIVVQFSIASNGVFLLVQECHIIVAVGGFSQCHCQCVHVCFGQLQRIHTAVRSPIFVHYVCHFMNEVRDIANIRVFNGERGSQCHCFGKHNFTAHLLDRIFCLSTRVLARIHANMTIFHTLTDAISWMWQFGFRVHIIFVDKINNFIGFIVHKLLSFLRRVLHLSVLYNLFAAFHNIIGAKHILQIAGICDITAH
mmetsp:Transcript_51566/g.85441  ORF Transcript_51566/g.85441 Transcript_51566/m.85441 type:complete len:237 (+) Transcript_51566:233-943(+)